ncbi:MAG: cupin domain-containing protein [Limibacillus sp.]|jgi:quercetin dioxygenase-like cupin family protein
MTEQEYHADLRAKGYSPAVEKTWEAGRLNDDHTHEGDLYLLILEGEMVVGMEGKDQRLTPGETCEVPGGLTHSEQAGGAGVHFLVATR